MQLSSWVLGVSHATFNFNETLFEYIKWTNDKQERRFDLLEYYDTMCFTDIQKYGKNVL